MKSVVKMLPVLLAITAFTSCANYGKKVKIEGTKGEVYYKGDGVTESDAKKLGTFLKESEYFDDKKVKSVQLMKAGDRYTVRFVADKAAYEKLPDGEQNFKEYGVQIAKAVFGGTKVDVALADENMEDFKTIPYDATVAQAPTPTTETSNTSTVSNENNGGDGSGGSLSDYHQNVAGGVHFYWKGITDEESKTIADYIVKNGSFYTTEGNVNIIMEKEGDKYLVKFPVADEYLQDPSIAEELKTVSQQIKDNVFANASYSFIMTDTKLNNIRSWDF